MKGLDLLLDAKYSFERRLIKLFIVMQVRPKLCKSPYHEFLLIHTKYAHSQPTKSEAFEIILKIDDMRIFLIS